MEYLSRMREKVRTGDYTESEWNKLNLWRYVKYVNPVIIELKDMPDT